MPIDLRVTAEDQEHVPPSVTAQNCPGQVSHTRRLGTRSSRGAGTLEAWSVREECSGLQGSGPTPATAAHPSSRLRSSPEVIACALVHVLQAFSSACTCTCARAHTQTRTHGPGGLQPAPSLAGPACRLMAQVTVQAVSHCRMWVACPSLNQPCGRGGNKTETSAQPGFCAPFSQGNGRGRVREGEG